MRSTVRVATFLAGLAFLASLLTTVSGADTERRILVYTKNGKGFVHDNIAASVEALKKLGEENRILVDVSPRSRGRARMTHGTEPQERTLFRSHPHQTHPWRHTLGQG